MYFCGFWARSGCKLLLFMVFRQSGAQCTTFHQGIYKFYKLFYPGQVGIVDGQFALADQISDQDLAP